jgi:hypothetical protein
MAAKKKALKLRKGFRHQPGGNCWEGVTSPVTPGGEDAHCSRHEIWLDGPNGRHTHPLRGECPTCPRCPACDNMNLATSLNTPDEPVRSLALVPDPTFVFNPTASKTDLLFACTYPFGRKLKREPVGERTRFGSAFHEGMEAGLASRRARRDLAKVWDVSGEELGDRVSEALPVIKAWLQGDNMWGLSFIRAGLQLEQSVAYDPATNEARLLPDGPGEHHDYPDRREGEIPGTADVVSLVAYVTPDTFTHRTLLVLDHKSGWNVAADWQPQTPAESGQLRTLALGLATLHGADQVIVAFFHAPRGGQPVIYADMLQVSDLQAHRKALRAALGNIGSGWMRPGDWCDHCPAVRVCPTQIPNLIELKRTPGPLTNEKVGAVHQALGTYRGLAEYLTGELRAWVQKNGPAVRPDGQTVDLIPRKRTNLSQASVVRAYGPLKGGKVLDKLRRDGAIEESENLELRATRR